MLFLFVLVEFGVLPEIAKAIDELEWTYALCNFFIL